MFVCIALAAGLAAEPTACAPLDNGARGRVVRYAQGLFNLPINSPLRISEEKVDAKTCYAQITVATSPPARNAFHRILFLFPIGAFLRRRSTIRRARPFRHLAPPEAERRRSGCPERAWSYVPGSRLARPSHRVSTDVIQVGWGFGTFGWRSHRHPNQNQRRPGFVRGDSSGQQLSHGPLHGGHVRSEHYGGIFWDPRRRRRLRFVRQKRRGRLWG